MVGALFHVKTDTIPDFTGTVTVFDSLGSTLTANATDLVRPSDWNSTHNALLTLNGNTSGVSTVSGTNIVLAGGFGINLSAAQGASAATVSIGLNDILTGCVPRWPASTGTQSMGPMGTSTASVFLHPFFLDGDIAFNALRLMASNSFVTSTVSGQQSLTSNWGIFSNNAGTLSLISSLSLSFAVTNSSGSATVSFATSTNVTGYGYATSSFSASALGQSLFGTATPRLYDLVLGAALTLTPGRYWLGLHQRQSSSSANIGLSSAVYGNVIATQHTNAQPPGRSAANTTNFSNRIPGFGVYTVTQTALPSAIPLTQIAHSLTVMPLLSLTST